MAKFYMTTAIDYVNSKPHLGTAYEKITADVIARFKRMAGYETRFMMGNDEHSLNVYKKADEMGLSPLAYCDQMEEAFREVWSRLNISFDEFIRTTEPRHHAGVQALVSRIHDAGDIYESEYEGWYCNSCEAFKQDKDLEDGNCPIHRSKPEWIEEKNHFFRLSKYAEPLLQMYRDRPSALEPDTRRNEILNVIEGGLSDISISRASQKWGIPIPFDTTSVVYVWFDALINYLSGVGFGADEKLCGQWWPADLHIVGKDITRFHSIIWPAMLMSAGLPVPIQVFGHGFINFQGERMSKTLGTVVDPLEAAEKFGPDPLRLYVIREITFGQDGDFSWDRFEKRYNADLANNLGNLVSRVTSMAAKYFDGRLESPGGDHPLRPPAEQAIQQYRDAMESLQLQAGAQAAFTLIDRVNEYLTETAPWNLAKDEARRSDLAAVLYGAAESTRIAALLLSAIMPESCEEIRRRLGDTQSSPRLDRDAQWGHLGTLSSTRGAGLWPRLEAASS